MSPELSQKAFKTKTVAIHQPQYLPWLPYLLKIAESDVFIILDSVDFQKNGLQNRNQVKTPQGASWLTVPVKQHLGQKLTEVEIQNETNWRKKHFQTILMNYRKSRAFSLYAGELEGIYNRSWERLTDLNVCLLEKFLKWFGIATPTLRSSEMKCEGTGSELVLNLCREAGATSYLSGIGGRDYMKEADFSEAGIPIVFRDPQTPKPYPQQHPEKGFIKDLSALDILLNCGAEWRNYL